MSKTIHLVLLYGGKSGEHEVALQSAASVLANLNPDKYRITPIAMDKDGQFHQHEYADLIAHKDKLPVLTHQSRPLDNLFSKGRLVVDADLVFPVAHGPLYEDGCLQGLLELAGVAYVGCDVLSSAIGMDKDLARRLACVDGLQSARYKLLSWHMSEQERAKLCTDAANEWGWPLFVKPASLGSSVGIHKVKNLNELSTAVADAFRYDEEVLIEEHLEGLEIEVAVLENPLPSAKPRASVPGEIRVNHPHGFYSYTAKYLESEATELLIPAPISQSLQDLVKEAAVAVFSRLKCKGLARVDFFVNPEKNTIYFNEINTLPGFTAISMYPKLWEATGLPYTDLLDALVEIALVHQHCREHIVTSYQ